MRLRGNKCKRVREHCSLLAVVSIALLSPTVSKPQTGTDLQRGITLAQAQHFVEAELLLSRAYEHNPNDVETLHAYGMVEARLGHYDKATEALRKAVRVAPARADLKLDCALALADQGDQSAALSLLDEAERSNPRLFAIHLNRARVLDDLHRSSLAAKEYAVADSIRPNDPECLSLWAASERGMGHLDRELELLERLRDIRPKDTDILLRLGKTLAEQKEQIRAISVLQEAYRLKPAAETAYLLSRMLRTSDEKESKAWMNRFQQLRLEQNTIEDVKTLGNEAVLAASRGEWISAIELNRRALKACNGCAIESGLHKNLGLALCQNKQIADGVNELRDAYRLDPNDPGTVQAMRVLGVLPE